jgi:TctA family transporter
MDNPQLRTPFGHVELRSVAAPEGALEGMRVYVLLPDLDELLGVPGFGLRDPIRVRGRKTAAGLPFFH